MARFLTVPPSCGRCRCGRCPSGSRTAGASPACSACSSSEAPLFSTRTSEPAKWIEPSASAARRRQARRDEALDVQPRLEAVGRPGLADRVEQGRAGRRRRSRPRRSRARPAARWARAEVPVGLARARARACRSGPGGSWVSRGEPLELVAVDRVLGVGGVVEEGDRAAVALGAERPQHRHHRGDAAAAADQQDPVGSRVGKAEVALGLLEAEDHAGPRAARAGSWRRGPRGGT